MALTDVKIKVSTLPAGKKQLRLADSGGLYLQITPSGKYWRMNYRFGKKQKTLSIGVYPAVTLKRAREYRDQAKLLLKNGTDPSQAKQQQKRKAIADAHAITFEAVTREWLAKKNGSWVPTTITNCTARFERHAFPWIGSLPIAEIEAPDVLSLIQRVEQRGSIETAHRLRMLCGQVFRYAVATSRIKSDPTRDLKGALTPLNSQHRATITDTKKIGELLRTIWAFKGTFTVQCALRITPYVFVRPGELRHVEWSEVDLDNAEWRIPAEKMKMRVAHIVPLASQVVEILRELQPLTCNSCFVFPSIRSLTRPMSENTINATLRRIGYTKDEMCAHGFRAMASTSLHEQGWDSDVIERQLAHKEGNAIKAAYNHARHLPERVKMMQAWADHLDGLRKGATVIPFNRKQA